MKRSSYEMELSTLDIAKCLIVLSQRVEITNRSYEKIRTQEEIYECNTCSKKFPSFQALGGHRASHKKPRVAENEKMVEPAKLLSIGVKPKMHECVICGQGFPTGQALGGHMRRHRADLGYNHVNNSPLDVQAVPKVPVLKRSSSCNKRVMGMDLNLTPLENDLKFLFGTKAPKVDPFIC